MRIHINEEALPVPGEATLREQLALVSEVDDAEAWGWVGIKDEGGEFRLVLAVFSPVEYEAAVSLILSAQFVEEPRPMDVEQGEDEYVGRYEDEHRTENSFDIVFRYPAQS